MYTKLNSYLAVLCLTLSLQARANDPKTMYVQSVQLEAKTTASQSGAKAFVLKRGDAVSILETKDHWVKISPANQPTSTGWTSKVFLSNNRPVGQAELAKDVPTSLEKASRRRSPSYTVNAAARGLAEDENLREKGDQYKSDFKALKKVEERKVAPSEVEKFKESANLPK